MGYTRHRKARTTGYGSATTTPRTPLHLPQPVHSPTQCHMNRCGLTGQRKPTRPLAQSPTRVNSASRSPGLPWRAPYPHPNKCTPATYTPAPSTIHGPRDLSGLCSGSQNPWGSLSRCCLHSYPPCDLSTLRLDAPNPWRSLHHHHSGHYAHAPRQFTRQRQYSPVHPANTYLHTITTPKPPTPAPVHIFETVRHPHGIGPTKPVIRVPAQIEMATSTYFAPSDRVIVKSAPPSHPAVPIQCHCGQLVPFSGNQTFRSILSHHTLGSFISQVFSLPFSFPRQFFSRFTFL
jgi:hypothetical protein